MNALSYLLALGLTDHEIALGLCGDPGPWAAQYQPPEHPRSTRDRSLEEDLFDRSWAHPKGVH